MNNMPFDSAKDINEDLADEYRFDYRSAKPNRFAARNEAKSLTVVVLDEDVAEIFETPEAVNEALRGLINSSS